MFLEVMLMFLEVIKCSWGLYNVPGGYTNKGRYRAARAAKNYNNNNNNKTKATTTTKTTTTKTTTTKMGLH